MKKIVLTLAIVLSLFSCEKDENVEQQNPLVAEQEIPQIIECEMPPLCGEETPVKQFEENFTCSILNPSKELSSFVVKSQREFNKKFACGYWGADLPLYESNKRMLKYTYKKSTSVPIENDGFNDLEVCTFPIYSVYDFSKVQIVGLELDGRCKLMPEIESIVENNCEIKVNYKMVTYQESKYNNLMDIAIPTYAVIPLSDKPVVFVENKKIQDYAIVGLYKQGHSGTFFKMTQYGIGQLYVPFSYDLSNKVFNYPANGTEIELDVKKLIKYLPENFRGEQYEGYKKYGDVIGVEDWIYLELMIDNQKSTLHLPVNELYYRDKKELVYLGNYIKDIIELINF